MKREIHGSFKCLFTAAGFCVVKLKGERGITCAYFLFFKTTGERNGHDVYSRTLDLFFCCCPFVYFRSASTVSALRRRPPLWPRYDYTHLSLHSSCKIGEMSSKSVVPNSPSHRKRRRVYGGRRKNPTGRQWPSHNKLNFHHLLLLVLRGGWRGLLHARHTFTFLYLREPCV